VAPFDIDTYQPRYLQSMVALYNGETDVEPYIARLSAKRFAELVECKSYFDAAGLFVARRAGEVIGWIHACVAPGSERGHDPEQSVPRIRLLIYPSHELKVGRALVAEATAWLRPHAKGEILAMHSKAGYPFYRGIWLGGEPKCPATMPHLHLALEVGGYKNTLESVFMTTEMREPPAERRARVKLTVETSLVPMAHGPMQESWAGFEPMQTQAFQGGHTVGTICWVIVPYVADRLGAASMSIWGMGVAEPHRRKGIASALLARAMAEAHELGARFCSVSTQLWNEAAQATYAKAGFQPHRLVAGRSLRLETQPCGESP
jgi:GNAT superfamily N-acetyltransferase